MSALETAAAAVSAILDRAIALDPEAPARVRRLAGQPLEIAIDGTGLCLQLIPDGEHLRVTAHPEQPAAARI